MAVAVDRRANDVGALRQILNYLQTEKPKSKLNDRITVDIPPPSVCVGCLTYALDAFVGALPLSDRVVREVRILLLGDDRFALGGSFGTFLKLAGEEDAARAGHWRR